MTVRRSAGRAALAAVVLAGLVLVAGATQRAWSAGALLSGTFYVSPSGDDGAAGTSPATAWRTIGRVNHDRFGPGTTILLEGGKAFPGALVFERPDRGTRRSPITVGSYGSGRAAIKARKVGIWIHNTAGIRIMNLRIVGPGPAAKSDSGIGALNDLPGNVKLAFLRIDGVTISGFGKWGIFIDGGNGKSGFKGVRITRVVAHDNILGGIDVEGEFSQTAKGYAHRNVYVGYTRVYDNPGDPSNDHHTGDGIVLSDVDGGTIEHSVAYGNGRLSGAEKGGPVGIWAWDANRITIQRNQSYANRSGGPKDGGGFDFDGGVTNSVMQYNVSHDNDGPGVLVYQFAIARPLENNVIRYNTSRNDARKNGDGAVWIAGGLAGVDFYRNNVLVSPRKGSSVAAVAVSQSNLPGQPPTTSDVNIHDNVLTAIDGLPIVAVVGRHRDLRFTNNTYVSRGGKPLISWNGKSYGTLAAWRAATGEEHVGGRATGRAVVSRSSGGRGDTLWLVLALAGGSALVVGGGIARRRRRSRARIDRDSAQASRVATRSAQWPAEASAPPQPRSKPAGPTPDDQPSVEDAPTLEHEPVFPTLVRNGIRRRRRGYDMRVVDRLMDQAATAYDAVCRQRETLRSRVKDLEEDLTRYSSIERDIVSALVSAKTLSAEMREEAQAESRQMLESAKTKAEAMMARVRAERDRLQKEVDELTTLRDELLSGQRAFVLAGFELLQEHEAQQVADAQSEASDTSA